MSKKAKLCPYKKVVERETSVAGVTVERERFQPCVGERCMAYRAPNYGFGESGPCTCKRME